MNGHRLIFEVSKPRRGQHDDRIRQSALARLAEENLAAVSPDLLRAMVKTFADALMCAEADAFCNAEYGQVKGTDFKPFRSVSR
ncbi:hypothetical protein ACFWBB_08150 [Streptomyces sp. NPDC060000]|uniref:hypothetical protein n=1 Tax=Streptomyces sp. NPDC060000 TaxID=3347031 RepID=UPI00367A7C32